MLGCGVDAGTPYWLAASSWNNGTPAYWGNQGYFLIRRRHDECGIESEVVAGKAETNRLQHGSKHSHIVFEHFCRLAI